ncbi:MAG: hypothetical protein SXV54_06625 [Chloroflexota bacterium]|nr:hypothetical protein [Chloroflexota bacterium]
MRSNANVPAALDTARRLLECAQGPPYLLNDQDAPDLANLVSALEELEALLPQVAHVRPWEGDAAVVVNGHIVYRFPDDDPAFSNTSQAVAERLARALGGTVVEVNLDGVDDWGQVGVAPAARERPPS